MIFMALTKPYDALDRYRSLEIRESYGLGHQAYCVLLRVLGQATDVGSCGWVLQGGIPRFSGGDPGGPAATYHFCCGGVRSGVSLDIVVGRRRRREVRVGKVGATPFRLFLRG